MVFVKTMFFTDELAFAPRVVELQADRDYKDLFKMGNEIGK